MNYTAYVPFYCGICGGLAKRPVIPLGVIAKAATVCPRCDKLLAQRAAERAEMDKRINLEGGKPCQ